MPTNCTITASTPCDLVRIPQGPMDEAEKNESFEDDLAKWTTAKRTLSGGPIYDQYGFATGYGEVLATDCIERSDVMSVCSRSFVNQIPKLVNDQPSTAIAETHVWARVLYKPLLKRALSAFDGEERRLTGARDNSAKGLFDD